MVRRLYSLSEAKVGTFFVLLFKLFIIINIKKRKGVFYDENDN